MVYKLVSVHLKSIKLDQMTHFFHVVVRLSIGKKIWSSPQFPVQQLFGR